MNNHRGFPLPIFSFNPFEMLEERQLEVMEIPGELPGTWDRSAVFFANLLSLFFGNKEQTRLLQEHVGMIETYGGRLIPVIDLLFRGGDNMLVLEREPVDELLDYFKNDLKLTLPEIRVVPHSLYTKAGESGREPSGKLKELLGQLTAHPSQWIDGFVIDEVLCRLSELTGKKKISSFEGSRQGNDKGLLHAFLAAEEIPALETYMAGCPEDVRRHLAALKEKGYSHAVLKAAIGASGIGMVKIDLAANADIPGYLFYAGDCLVQGWLDESYMDCRTLGSPSVQIFVGEESISLYDVTDQILSHESIHEGNISPPLCAEADPSLYRALFDSATKVAEWLHGRGYRGTASVDFLLIEQSGRKTAYVCELNARVTGATYPSLLARHFLPGGAWQMRNVLFTPPQSPAAVLDVMRKEKLLYAPGGKSGMFPINFNQNREGEIEKCQLLALAPDVPATMALFDKLKPLKAFSWDYDRD